MVETTLRVVAACDRCGRGYVHIAHEGVRCMECGNKRPGGRLFYLPEPEANGGDPPEARARRKLAALCAGAAPPQEQTT